METHKKDLGIQYLLIVLVTFLLQVLRELDLHNLSNIGSVKYSILTMIGNSWERQFMVIIS